MRPAEFVLVAGPNGSGKSTVADAYIEIRFPIWPKINADRVNLALSRERNGPASMEQALEAAKLVDTTAQCLALLKSPFILETVLSSEKYCSLVQTARRNGLIFRLVYITTVHPDINVARVRQRVLEGGHDVPADRIRERWIRSMNNLAWFAARADRLVVADNSGATLRVLGLRHFGNSLEILTPDHPASRKLEPIVGTRVLET
jgi:predicted ABC-type ATPase